MNAPQIKMSKGLSIKKWVEYDVFPISSSIQSDPWLFIQLIWELCDILPSRRTKEAEHTTWQSFKTKKEFLDHLHFYWSSLATDIVSNKIIFCNFFIYFLFLFFQACTEVSLPAGSNNETDMFPALPFTPEMRAKYCQDKWGVAERSNWPIIQFWGKGELH